MRRLFASLAAVASVSAPALACINDSELATHEREFRSSYQNGRSPSAASEEPSWQAKLPTTLSAAGGVLFIAAGFVTFRRLSAKG